VTEVTVEAPRETTPVYDRAYRAVLRAMKKGEIDWEATVGLANAFRLPPREIRMIVGQIRRGE
jgi:hypothetical protein